MTENWLMTGVGEILNMSHLVWVCVCKCMWEKETESGGGWESVYECMTARNHVIENAYQTVISFWHPILLSSPSPPIFVWLSANKNGTHFYSNHDARLGAHSVTMATASVYGERSEGMAGDMDL